jgi:hypothetical protein
MKNDCCRNYRQSSQEQERIINKRINEFHGDFSKGTVKIDEKGQVSAMIYPIGRVFVGWDIDVMKELKII